jgi:hypothetical protein
MMQRVTTAAHSSSQVASKVADFNTFNMFSDEKGMLNAAGSK